jgi:hypothetical protein
MANGHYRTAFDALTLTAACELSTEWASESAVSANTAARRCIDIDSKI